MAMCRAVLEAFEPWDACWCWRPGRHWEFSPGRDLGDEMQAFLQVRARAGAARIPATFPGALLLGKGERDLVLALMVLACYTSRNRDEDLYIVPDHCRQLALVCHHDDVHVECPNAGTMCSYVARMRDAGIELPTEMREPGAPPEWMKR
jgi:hypothetical protein